MKVEFTLEARSDLDSIGEWIAQANPSRAVSFLLELQTECFSLAVFPARHPIYKQTSMGALHRKVYGNYLIFYVVKPDAVSVVRILHGAQDYADLF